MRYCRFIHDDEPQYGRIEGDDIVEGIVFEGSHTTPFISPVKLRDAQLLAPATPSKILCVGRNYREHASELGNEVPAEPLIFFKPPSAIIGPGAAIKLPPASLTQRVDYEGEFGVIIGERCRNLGEDENVRAYIRGYTCVNDVTARDLQKKDSQWTRAKGFDTFCPVGPVVVTPDELIFERGIEVTTRLNGKVKQEGNTRDFIFTLEHLIRYISQAMTLEPGDLISTGTPAGVGPMKSGDEVEVEVSGVGVLRNRVT